MKSDSPAVHSVHIYERDSELIDRLCSIFATALRAGNYALVIATPEHGDALASALGDVGVDVGEYVRAGFYRMFDAAQVLATFMVRGLPDRTRFDVTVGSLLAQTREAAHSDGRNLTVFGEMVAALWNAGNKAGALRLEALWNDALNDRSFHLHCAYPRYTLADQQEIHAVCQPHSHVVQ